MSRIYFIFALILFNGCSGTLTENESLKTLDLIDAYLGENYYPEYCLFFPLPFKLNLPEGKRHFTWDEITKIKDTLDVNLKNKLDHVLNFIDSNYYPTIYDRLNIEVIKSSKLNGNDLIRTSILFQNPRDNIDYYLYDTLCLIKAIKEANNKPFLFNLEVNELLGRIYFVEYGSPSIRYWELEPITEELNLLKNNLKPEYYQKVIDTKIELIQSENDALIDGLYVTDSNEYPLFVLKNDRGSIKLSPYIYKTIIKNILTSDSAKWFTDKYEVAQRSKIDLYKNNNYKSFFTDNELINFKNYILNSLKLAFAFPLAHELAHIYLGTNNESLCDCYGLANLLNIDSTQSLGLFTSLVMNSIITNNFELWGKSSDNKDFIKEIQDRYERMNEWSKVKYKNSEDFLLKNCK